MDVDVLIVGQGIAGATLAWRLIERGVMIAVVDPWRRTAAQRPSASRVAAGLITPLTGKRLTVDPEFDGYWESAQEFYRRTVEAECGASVLEERPAVRMFVSKEESEQFDQRSQDSAFARHARRIGADETPELVLSTHEGCVMPGAARLRVVEYLNSTQRWLSREGRCFDGWAFERELIERDGRLAFESIDVAAKRVVFCVGHDPAPHGTPPRLAPAKGEVLTVEIPGFDEQRVVHRGVWIAPDESRRPGRYRVGATYNHDDLSAVPTASGKRELLARLAEAGVTNARVVGHQAAVRPATSDRRPTFGFRPDEPRVGWFNGLGSKGSLLAPAYAARMAELAVESLGD